MEIKDKFKENDKILRNSENINGLLLKELIFCVDEFLNRKNDTAQHLSAIIKRIFYNNLKVFDKNVSNMIKNLIGTAQYFYFVNLYE